MASARQQIIDRLSDWKWRLNNLYFIVDKEGQETLFRMNWAQEALFDGMHYQDVILKARQLGLSTFIVLFILDACLFNENVAAGLIDITLDDVKAKVEKASFAYQRLPEWIKKANPITTQNKLELRFRNGSHLKGGTSHRGGTLNYLHVSELGKIAAKYPDRAREIRTGALNTIKAGQIVFIESTAEGHDGDFYVICDVAQGKARTGAKLTPLDMKFFFFPWWKEPDYRLDPDGVPIPQRLQDYFAKLEKKDGIKLDAAQRAWYAKKYETQLGDMKREYPSTPEEAFEASVEGAIFGEWMTEVEESGRVGIYPAVPGVKVNSVWDIGRKDYTAIWFFQVLEVNGRPRIRIVGFYMNTMREMPDYAAYCFGTEVAQSKFPEHVFKEKHVGIYQERGWEHGEDFFPHDAKQTEWGTGRGRMEQLKKAGFNAKLAGAMGLHDGINAARATFAFCEFDEAATAEGRKMLKSYRWEWDDNAGAWNTKVPNDKMICAHASDSWRYLSTSWRLIIPKAADAPPLPKRIEVTEIMPGGVKSNIDPSKDHKLNPKEFIEMIKRSRTSA